MRPVPKLLRLTAPTAEPVSLAEAKSHLRVDSTDEDALITAIIGSARQIVEDYTNRPWADGAWAFIYSDFPASSDPMETPFNGIAAIDSIVYLDPDQAPQTLAGATYTLDDARRQIRTTTAWPETLKADAVRVDATVGGMYVPPSIIQAILLYIGDLFENRTAQIEGSSISENPAAINLMQPLRLNMGI